ncbi:MAG: hypothetical protein H7X97_10505 [Opitutaceae bacterium]|nr:hypothetical protein [Verrucomicrobiales bacterium]
MYLLTMDDIFNTTFEDLVYERELGNHGGAAFHVMNTSTDHLKDLDYQKLLALNPPAAKSYLWIGRFDVVCAVGATLSFIAAMAVVGAAWLRDGWSGGSSVGIGWFFIPSLLSFLLLLGSWQRFRILRKCL